MNANMIAQNFPLYVVMDEAATIGLVIGWADVPGDRPRPYVQSLSGETEAAGYPVSAYAKVRYFVSRSEAEVYVRTVR